MLDKQTESYKLSKPLLIFNLPKRAKFKQTLNRVSWNYSIDESQNINKLLQMNKIYEIRRKMMMSSDIPKYEQKNPDNTEIITLKKQNLCNRNKKYFQNQYKKQHQWSMTHTSQTQNRKKLQVIASYKNSLNQSQGQGCQCMPQIKLGQQSNKNLFQEQRSLKKGFNHPKINGKNNCKRSLDVLYNTIFIPANHQHMNSLEFYSANQEKLKLIAAKMQINRKKYCKNLRVHQIIYQKYQQGRNCNHGDVHREHKLLQALQKPINNQLFRYENKFLELEGWVEHANFHQQSIFP